MYPRNAASPERLAVGAIYQISDGAIQTSGASATVTPQGGSETAAGGTLACLATSGIWVYTPTQAETNYASFVVSVYKASCTSASITVVTTAESTAGKVSLGAAQTTDITGSVSGSVGSVTGAVGSVTGAVGSVTGNVGGNVVGSVASVTDKTGFALTAAYDAAKTAATQASVDTIDGIVDTIVARVIGTLAAGTHNAQSGDAYAAVAHATYGLNAVYTNYFSSASIGFATIDTVCDTISSLCAGLYTLTGTPAGASVSADIAAIKAQTAAIEADTQDLQTQVGTDGAGLTNLPWNASWDAEVQSECTDALNAYDPPTKAELDSGLAGITVTIDQDDIDAIVAGISAAGVVPEPGTATTLAIRRGQPYQAIPIYCSKSGSAETGIAGTLTARWSKAGAAFANASLTTCIEIGGGWYYFFASATETDAAYGIASATCTDGDVIVRPTLCTTDQVASVAKAVHGAATYFVTSTGAAGNTGLHPDSPFASVSSVPSGAYTVIGIDSFGTVSAAITSKTLISQDAILQAGAYTISDCVLRTTVQCKGDFDRCRFERCRLYGISGSDHNLTGDDNLFLDCTASSSTSKGLTTFAMNRSLVIGGAPILAAGTAWTLSGSNNTFVNVDFGAVNFTISGNNNRFINCQHTGTRTDNGTGNVWDASPVTSDATIAKLRFDNANRLVTAGGRGAMIGSDPGFLFDVAVAAAEGKVLSAEEPDVTDTPVLDATKRESYYATVMSLGTQWQLTATTLQDDPNGVNPAIEYESEDTDIATVDPDGLVRYVADGEVVIACTSAETAASEARRNEVRITNSHNEEAGYTVTEYIPDAVVAADHVLVVYNADDADSIEIKNYYLANRPGMSGAQTLGITGCPTTEYVEDGLFDSTVRAQVAAALGADSIIRYIVVCRGIPTRLTADGTDKYYLNGEVCSAAYRLAYCLHDLGVRTGSDYTDATARFSVGQYQRMAGLVTHLDMGSKAATLAYIDKLAAVGALAGALDADGVTISASGAGAGGDIYVLDGEATYGGGQVSDRNTALLAEGVSSEDITLRNDGEGNVTSAADVTYYQSWGVHTIWTGEYALDGSVQFSGVSNWYLIETFESFNGVLTSSHGTYADWFSAAAFGGSNYSNTPVGAVAHTAEPGTSASANDEYYAALWARGWTFAECAWQSRRMRHFIAVGDPLVRR